MANNLKSKFRAEIQKLKQMKSFKDRFDYIWEYYKLYIICIIAAIVAISYTVNMTLINPPKKIGVGLTLTSGFIENADIFKADAEKAIGMDSNHQLDLTEISLDGDNPKYQYIMQQKFMVMIAANEIDLIIGNADFFSDFYSTKSTFIDLTSLLKDKKYAAIENKFKEALIPIEYLDKPIYIDKDIVKYTDEFTPETEIDCIKRPVAVKLDNSEIFKSSNSEDLYIGFSSAGIRTDMALKLFDYIVGLN